MTGHHRRVCPARKIQELRRRQQRRKLLSPRLQEGQKDPPSPQSLRHHHLEPLKRRGRGVDPGAGIADAEVAVGIRSSGEASTNLTVSTTTRRNLNQSLSGIPEVDAAAESGDEPR